MTTVAIKAFVAAEGACILATGGHAFANQADMGLNDKTAHCYASCMISRNCGRLPAWLAGYTNEIVDELQHQFGATAWGAEWADVIANFQGRWCSGWETYTIIGGYVGRWFRQSCLCCCKNLKLK